MAYVGRYINLDRSTDRRRVLEDRFAALGCADRYTRFAAVEGTSVDRSRTHLSAGECGCFESHYRCIKESMDQDTHLHIIEDDVVFGPSTITILDQVLDNAFRQSEMAFTDVFVPGDLSSLVVMMSYYRLTGVLDGPPAPGAKPPKYVNFPDLKSLSFAGSASYVLRSDARARMLALMEAELAAGPTMPVDMFFNKIVHDGLIKACCTMPFLTSVDPNEVVSTTIHGRSQHDRSNLAFFMIRNYFFVDKDQAALDLLGRELAEGMEDPGYMNTLFDAFRFIFSPHFVAL